MRKLLCSLFFLAFIPLLTFASGTEAKGKGDTDPFKKSDFKIRHIPGERAIGVVARYTPDGYGAECQVTFFKRKGFSYSAVISPLFGQVGQTDFQQVKVGFRPQKILWDYRKNLFLSVFATGYAGFENFQNDMLDMSDRGVFLSIGIGPELEYCFNNKTSLISAFQQDYNPGSDMGDFTFSAFLGVRIKF